MKQSLPAVNYLLRFEEEAMFKVGDKATVTREIRRKDNREVFRVGETVIITSVYSFHKTPLVQIVAIKSEYKNRIPAIDVVVKDGIPLIPF